MKTFKDSEGREWKIVVNVNTAKAVKDLTTVNLFDLYTKEAERVFTDPILLVNVIYVLCQDQCKERGVSDVSFGEGLVGDAIENAANALLLEVADFFPSSRQKLMQAMVAKSQIAGERMTARAMEQLNQMDVETSNAPTNSRA